MTDPSPLDDLKRFFELLDWVEESDNGKEFHPLIFSCCRTWMCVELERILKRLKARANMSPAEWSQHLSE